MRGFWRSCVIGLLGLALFEGRAPAETTITCPNGEVRIHLNIRDIALSYNGISMSATVAKLGPFSYSVSLTPAQLQAIATETQRMNEFIKGLVVAYNGCVISSQEFRDGLFRLYPRLDENAIVSDRIVTTVSQNQTLNESDRRLFERAFRILEKIAELDENNTERILFAIEHTSIREYPSGPGNDYSQLPFGLGQHTSTTGSFAQTDSPMGGAWGSVTGVNQTFLSATITGGVLNPTGDLSSFPALAKDGSVGLAYPTGVNQTLLTITGGVLNPTGNLSSFPALAKDGSVGLAYPTGVNQTLLTITGGVLNPTGDLSSFPALAKDGSVGLAYPGSTWGQVRSLDQSVTILNAALVRSAINPNLSQYDFPNIAVGGSGSFQSITPVAGDFGSTPLLQLPNSLSGNADVTAKIK